MRHVVVAQKHPHDIPYDDEYHEEGGGDFEQQSTSTEENVLLNLRQGFRGKRKRVENHDRRDGSAGSQTGGVRPRYQTFDNPTATSEHQREHVELPKASFPEFSLHHRSEKVQAKHVSKQMHEICMDESGRNEPKPEPRTEKVTRLQGTSTGQIKGTADAYQSYPEKPNQDVEGQDG